MNLFIKFINKDHLIYSSFLKSCRLPSIDQRVISVSGQSCTKSPDIIEILKNRKLISFVSKPSISEHLLREKRTVYFGIDPTFRSLHIGHLQNLFVLGWLLSMGHKVIILLGDFTRRIGDPSFRTFKRTNQTTDTKLVHTNETKIKNQIENFFKTSLSRYKLDLDNNLEFVYNSSWLSKLNITDFIQTCGSTFKINDLLSRDFLKTKLNGKDGMLMEELVYPQLQAYDFLHLYRNHKCTIQLGGHDQWGNISCGLELINKSSRKLNKNTLVYGLTSPLMISKNGEKIGKSNIANSIWLDTELTSNFDMYHHFMKTKDDQVKDVFHKLTYNSEEEINQTIKENRGNTHLQLALSDSILRCVRGNKVLEQIKKINETFVNKNTNQLHNLIGIFDIDLIIQERILPIVYIEEKNLIGINLSNIMVAHGIAQNEEQANELITKGRVNLNNKKITDLEYVVELQDIINQKAVFIRTGRYKIYLLKVIKTH